jgi:hypothetical protein
MMETAMRSKLAFALALALVGCGGRSQIGSSIPRRTDGGLVTWPDGPRPVKDTRPWLDGGPWLPDGPISDWLPWKKDAGKKDAPKKDIWKPDATCLPAPGYLIGASYKGSWSGTIFCGSGIPPQNMSGTLLLSLAQTSSAQFAVKGTLQGTVAGGLPVAGTFSGAMSCTSLSATISQLTVGSGVPIYTLQGSLSGTLGTAGTLGFQSGKLSVKEPTTGCWAEGSWYAYK